MNNHILFTGVVAVSVILGYTLKELQQDMVEDRSSSSSKSNPTVICIDRVKYFPSTLTPQYTPEGKIATCYMHIERKQK
jgi:hypothetical protein